MATLGFPGGSLVKGQPPAQGTWVPSLLPEDPLEKEMAAHSSILARSIPGTEEPGGLQSMGLQRVGQALLTVHAHTHTRATVISNKENYDKFHFFKSFHILWKLDKFTYPSSTHIPLSSTTPNKRKVRDLPGVTGDKNPLARGGEAGSSPGQGRSRGPQGNQSCASQPPCSPSIASPPEPACCSRRRPGRNPSSPVRETTTLNSPPWPRGGGPAGQQLEKAGLREGRPETTTDKMSEWKNEFQKKKHGKTTQSLRKIQLPVTSGKEELFIS